ncbi:MAG: TraR/DksA family transcriptional regulator [Nitrospirota bacterium]|jgi:DnaK suppressor protein
MEKIQKEIFKKVLNKKREEILKSSQNEIKNCLSGEARQTFGTGLDLGDLSAFHQSENMRYRQLGSKNEIIKKIDVAITRLKEGNYGICEECNDEISEERLKVVPFAIYCRNCQELKEARNG